MTKLVIKENVVYKCGTNFVRIIQEIENELHPTCFYRFVGIHCDEDGKSKSCKTGMFNSSGGNYINNADKLKFQLEALISEEEQREIAERNEKLERIAEIEKQLTALKESL